MPNYISNIELINHIRDDLTQLTPTEKLAALMLASRRNAYSLQCNPSHNRIAKDMGASLRTSINTINNLVKKKIISRLKDRFRSNHYLFYWDLKVAYESCNENPTFVFTENEIFTHLQ